jgi:TetR/AcrR family transcriptional regulator, repressor of fatR-cypB operon
VEALPEAPRRRGRPPVEGMRERILAAALRVFAERGFHGTAVPLVADAARVATGTLYRYFPSKEALVNEVFRDAKGRLARALYEGLDVAQPPPALFAEIWRRVVRFARREPVAFHFLEMQDHTPYLDAKSLELERGVLGPIVMAASHLRGAGGGRRALPPDVMIAFAWGALVGLFKAERLGYLQLADAMLERAGDACWNAITGSETTVRPKAKKRGQT